MRKIETIWHQILFQALNEQKFKFTQQELSKDYGYSLSTVHYALEVPCKIGAIRKTGKFAVLDNFKKLLFYWASQRRLSNDIIYQTHSDKSVQEREGFIIPEAIFAGYSAAKQILDEPPAGYDKVYFYAQEQNLEAIKDRFPEDPPAGEAGGPANLFVLKKIKTLDRFGSWTTIPQTFVDIWNCSDWYARDFISSLEKKIDGLLS